ncbi:MAG: ABC transporter ATP-binding protein [Defluviitaleaceae bacterium]|nr:ABC transporter ATP-binding protein [Defluviitaleaceae bacterium]
MNALEIKGLTKKYKEFTLNSINFNITKGSIMGFVGPNGAGKTTTIKAILNMINIDAGEIILWGNSNGNSNADRKIFNQIGVVADFTIYDSDWKVRDINKYIAPFYANWNASLFFSNLGNFDVSADKKISELSAGQNTKLMLAVALSFGAKLLILDEPSSGLDPMARDEFCDLITDFIANSNGENTVLFSTHIVSDLEKIADYITFILNGNIIFSDDKAEIMSKYSNESAKTLEDVILKFYKGGAANA